MKKAEGIQHQEKLITTNKQTRKEAPQTRFAGKTNTGMQLRMRTG
jgi:hypothetical protein